MTDLPRPKIDVTRATDRDPDAAAGSVDVVIHRDGKGRSYRSVGGDTPTVVADALEKVLGDRYTGEWIP